MTRDGIEYGGRIERSAGHIAFLGEYEYFRAPDGDVWRAPTQHTRIDRTGGYRTDARFYCTAGCADGMLHRARVASVPFAEPDASWVVP